VLCHEWDIHLSQVETLEAPRRRGSDGTGARLSVGGPTSRPTRACGCSRSSARIHADLSQMDNPLTRKGRRLPPALRDKSSSRAAVERTVGGHAVGVAGAHQKGHVKLSPGVARSRDTAVRCGGRPRPIRWARSFRGVNPVADRSAGRAPGAASLGHGRELALHYG